MKGSKRTSPGLVVTIDDDVEVVDAAAARQPASTSLHSSGTPGPSPSHKLKPAAAVKKTRSKSSRGTRLLKVVELGGGTAADLGHALLKAGPQQDDVAILKAALKVSKRHDGNKSGSQSSTRRRSVDMLGVVTLGGGTPAALIDAMMHDPEAEDMAVVKAALERAATEAGPSGSVKVEDTAQLQTPAGTSRDAGACAAATVEAQPAQAPASQSQKKQLCRVCRAQERSAGYKKTCADCATLILRLSQKSGGVCKRAHVRDTYAELGAGAHVRDVKRRALQLATEGQNAGGAAAAAEPAAALTDGSGELPQAGHSPAAGRVAEMHVRAAPRARVVKQEAAEAPAAHPSAQAAPPAAPAAAAAASPRAPPAAPSPPGIADVPAAAGPAAAAQASPPPGVPGPAHSGSTTHDTEPQGMAAAGAPPGAPGEPHATTSAPPRMCSVCAHQVSLPGGSYCVRCRSLASMIKRKGAIAAMRTAYEELGIGAARATVRQFVNERLDAEEARGVGDKNRGEGEP